VRRAILFSALGVLTPLSLIAQRPSQNPDLGDLDIEQLAKIRVTSAARRPQPLSQAAAAIFVITRDDIARSGAASLPEALRLAPGLEVARSGARDWAISARGFNDVVSNKLLVLVDGRAVYSPLFAGVFWDVQDIVLQDVDRIEVILGPGATLWGSNAVNGVINVVTRATSETKGALLEAHAGTEDRFGGTARYGARLKPGITARVYGKYSDRDPADLLNGDPATDNWRLGQGGFRLDAQSSSKNRFTFQGDAFAANGQERQLLPQPDPPYAALDAYDLRSHGGNLLGRWVRSAGEPNLFTVQGYVDRTVREQPPYLGRAALTVADLDVKHRFVAGKHHSIVWGVGARLNHDDVTGAYPVSMVPARRTTYLVTGFVQDEIAPGSGRLRATIGTKIEHETFAGLSLQPNVRVLWQAAPSHSLWGAVSRAVRTPSRVDTDIFENAGTIPGPPPTAITVVADTAFQSEQLMAYELGYRGQPTARLTFDADLYYNAYDHLRAVLPPASFTPGQSVVTFAIVNGAMATSYGGTAAASWRVSPRLRLRADYTYLHLKIEAADSTPTAISDLVAELNPRHQAALRASLSLPARIDLDLAARYVSPIHAAADTIPHYLQGDLRLAWSPMKGVSIAAIGQDLFSPRHREFRPRPFGAEQRAIERRGRVQVEWRF
jgi:iron complex outermembrane recepter protein